MKQAKDTEPVRLVRYITSNGPLRVEDEFGDDEDNEGDYFDPDDDDFVPEGD
jgi:hypothetical protein